MPPRSAELPMNTAAGSSSPPRPRGHRLWRLRLLLVANVVIVAVFAWWWGGQGPEPPEVPEGIRDEVRAALTAARAEVVEHPRRAAAWGHLGLVFTAHGFDDQAAECYREAHRMDADDDRWPYLLGLYDLTDGRDPSAAIGYLEAALACPHRTVRGEDAIRLRLAEAYLTELRLDSAEQLFRNHLGRAPADPRGLVGLGQTLLAADRPADAVEFLRGATSSPFTRRKATASLGVAARLLKQDADAARYDEQAAKLPEDIPPTDPFAAEAAALRADGLGGYEEALALEKQGRIREAIPLLARLAEDPADVRAAVALGQDLSLLGEFAAAEPYLRAACERAPENAQAALLLGTVLFDLARAETRDPARKTRLLREAADSCGRAIQLKPDAGAAHLCRGAALQGLGDLPAALPHFRLAVECRPEVPLFHLGLLQALLDSEQWDEAASRLPAAERVVPADHPRLGEIRKQLAGRAPPGHR